MPYIKSIDESEAAERIRGSVKRMLLSAALTFLVLGAHATAHAEKLRACYPAIAGNIVPLWIAKEKGFFAKQGLDVDLTFIRGGTTAVAVMLSREAAFCMIAGPGLILSHLSGSDLVMVAGLTNTFDFTVFGAKGIQRIEELRGKKAAVSRFGSASDFAIRYILQRHGLIPGQDVTILQIGDNNVEGIAGLETGTIQATPINPPMSLVAREKGFPELADWASWASNTSTWDWSFPRPISRTIASRLDVLFAPSWKVSGFIKPKRMRVFRFLQNTQRSRSRNSCRKLMPSISNLFPENPTRP